MEQNATVKLYEVLDVTCDDTYFTVGIWPTLAEAIAALDECSDPEDLGSPGYHDDYCEVEIRERAWGWSDLGKLVHKREWVGQYDEAKDEFVWVVKVAS